MTQFTVIHVREISEDQLAQIHRRIPGDLIQLSNHCRIKHEDPVDQASLAELRACLPFDINPLPPDFAPERVCLIVSDMDSTLIAIECIDELADQLGIKAQVAAITEAAMRGELVFEDALRQRVALLVNLPVTELQQVYDQRLRFNPGAEALMALARQQGLKTAVVSGGFTFFTEQVKAHLHLDFALANQLEIHEDRLTGQLAGAICGAEGKAKFLQQLCDELAIETSQCIAVGDGANDLAMLTAAGLGVAYHAKPVVQAQADAVINHGSLESVAHFFETES